jgi:hypothetical protein
MINFQMHADTTELLVGQSTLVTVSAWIDDPIAVAGNGLDTWQLDATVDVGGVVSVTGLTMIAPDPDTGYANWTSLNSPDGAIDGATVTQQTIGAPSNTGVLGYGDDDELKYSDIFSFSITALAEGTVTYAIGGDGGGFYAFLADDSLFENAGGADGGVYFDAAGSDNVFDVSSTPEPCTMLLLGIGSLVLRRRR